MENIFINHPHFNNANIDFQRAHNKHLLNTAGIGIDTRHRAVIPMNCIELPLLKPQKYTVIAACDTMSDIDCMGINPTLYYRNLGLIKHDPTGVNIMTGNGKFTVHNYVPITIQCRNNQKLIRKFWCLENLPTYDYLIGKFTLPLVGYELQRTYQEYIHNPTNIDNVECELDDLLCSNYPLIDEQKLDFSDLRIENPLLGDFVKDQLSQYETIVAKHEFDSGTLHDMEFEIKLKPEHMYTKNGFLSKEYWMNAKAKRETKIQIDGLNNFGLISQIKSAKYVSPLFSVPKKTGDVRIVFDYRKLNAITVRNRYPIPDTQKLLTRFRNKNFITSLDLKGGYWHIPIKESDRHKTAFIFDGKIYQWNRMPFGPMNSPEFFQQCMNQLFGHLPFVVAYIDDISILSDTIEEHKSHLCEIFEILKQIALNYASINASLAFLKRNTSDLSLTKWESLRRTIMCEK